VLTLVVLSAGLDGRIAEEEVGVGVRCGGRQDSEQEGVAHLAIDSQELAVVQVERSHEEGTGCKEHGVGFFDIHAKSIPSEIASIISEAD